ncbi:ribonuclease H-like domain-containing protein [Tanacetum coccineum]
MFLHFSTRSMPTTLDDEDLCKLMSDVLEEIDIRTCAVLDKMDLVILMEQQSDDAPYGKLSISSGDETLTDSTYENVKREKATKQPLGMKVVNQDGKQNTSQSAIDRNKVIIRDWLNSDDEETDVSESQKKTVYNTRKVKNLLENRSPTSNHLIRTAIYMKEPFQHTKLLKSKGNTGVHGKPQTFGTNIQRSEPLVISQETLGTSTKGDPLFHQAVLTREGLISTARPKVAKTYLESTAQWQSRSGSQGPIAIIDSGMLGSMTGDKDKLSEFKEFKGVYVALGKRLLKHNVLFTDKECLILSPQFKFVDEDLVILRAPRKNDVYSLDLKNIIPSGGITCLVAKATEDEAVLWHRRLGHVNFKNINKLVKGNLVRGLPSKTFKLDHSCVV